MFIKMLNKICKTVLKLFLVSFQFVKKTYVNFYFLFNIIVLGTI